ncbi:DUF4124 domain-containing protein [Undibacterium sp. SXout7W]|uniref:DUF4124 domain-containing protein n=1 Tax=Undibacterium sp. SXout7W TaxID=3413049 RepID=UPI003BF028DF
MSSRHHIIFLLTASFLCASAHAQYVWLDEKGSKQYSDTPPPVSTPANRIIRSPSQPAKPASTPTDTPASSAGETAGKPQKPVTTASKNEEFNKRRTQQAENEKKAAEEQQANTDKAKNCERAKAYQKALDSGIRIATTDKNGEKSYMTDEQKSKEMSDAKRILSGCQ